MKLFTEEKGKMKVNMICLKKEQNIKTVHEQEIVK